MRIHISGRHDPTSCFVPLLIHTLCERIGLWLTHTSTVAKRKVIQVLLAIKMGHFPPPRKLHAAA